MRLAVMYWAVLQVGALPVHAQSSAFEVASIKPSPDVAQMMAIGPELRNGTLYAERVTLRMLLAAAYEVTEPRIIGPDWLDKNRFNVMAKSPQGVPDRDLKPMLQTLLRDRFKLTAHAEMKEMAVYFLRVARGGIRMPVYPRPIEVRIIPATEIIRDFP